MTEPTIICPNCSTEIKLTESLAAPLIAATRREFEQQLKKKDQEVHKRETSLKEREEALSREKENLDGLVNERLRSERTKIAAEESARAQRATADDLEQKAKELGELRSILQQREQKLAEAQKAQAELIRKQRELDDAKREIELTIEKRVQAALLVTREQARKEAEDALSLRVREKEQTIASMQRQIEDLKRRAEQGSQQLQGEVQELELETLLAENFPEDLIDPVPKGEFGGDVLQHVSARYGDAQGTILWESKRTKNWSDAWLAKLRDDQRVAKAELAVIVSQALPKDVDSFTQIDRVWVCHPSVALPLAAVLRHSLTELAQARQASEGRQTKTELIYQYLTGPGFRHRVEAIVEAFSTMREDLDKERKVITRQWAKREMQITKVMQSTVGMYGDLQGIAGRSLKEIEGLEFPALSAQED